MFFKPVIPVRVVALSALILMVACQKGEESTEKEFHGIASQVRVQGSEFKVPAQAWDALLSVPPEAEHEKKAEGGEPAEGESKGGAPPAKDASASSFQYGPIKVLLKAKTSGVLKDSEIRIDLPDGGGEVDLSQWTTGKTGSFFVQFGWDGDDSESTDQKVIFYSRAKKRRVGEQLIGSGCRSFMDLTPAVLGQKKSGGFTVNTTRNFHSTVLGGHFLFSWIKGGARKVTQVTFRDSQNPQFFCENEK